MVYLSELAKETWAILDQPKNKNLNVITRKINNSVHNRFLDFILFWPSVSF